MQAASRASVVSVSAEIFADVGVGGSCGRRQLLFDWICVNGSRCCEELFEDVYDAVFLQYSALLVNEELTGVTSAAPLIAILTWEKG